MLEAEQWETWMSQHLMHCTPHGNTFCTEVPWCNPTTNKSQWIEKYYYQIQNTPIFSRRRYFHWTKLFEIMYVEIYQKYFQISSDRIRQLFLSSYAFQNNEFVAIIITGIHNVCRIFVMWERNKIPRFKIKTIFPRWRDPYQKYKGIPITMIYL